MANPRRAINGPLSLNLAGDTIAMLGDHGEETADLQSWLVHTRQYGNHRTFADQCVLSLSFTDLQGSLLKAECFVIILSKVLLKTSIVLSEESEHGSGGDIVDRRASRPSTSQDLGRVSSLYSVSSISHNLLTMLCDVLQN